METDEFRWRSIDNLNIYGKYWAPENDLRGVVALVHGMGEHSGRYEHLGEFLTKNNVALIAYDQRGHGRSEGKKGHTPSYDHLLQGVENLLYKAGEIFPEAPTVLYGHSMGGNLVLNYVLRKKPQLNGVIASSPWLRLSFDPPALKLKLGRWMKNIFPAFSQSTGLDVNAISSIKEEVKKYENDPLVHNRITASMFTEIYDSGLWALENAHEFDLPLLIFHGTGDKLTSYAATKEFAAQVKSDVTYKEFPGAFHETHNDVCRNDVFALLKSWLDEHL